MSWKPEVEVEGKWTRNGLVFETEQETKDYAQDLFHRWTQTTNHRAVEVDEPVNYTYHDHKLQPILNEQLTLLKD